MKARTSARTPRRVAKQAHRALKVAIQDYDRAQQNVVLRFAEIMEHSYYRDLGYSSMRHYACDGLGFSASKTTQFVRLARDLKRLPALERALEANLVGWTTAREIGKVANPENAEAWIDRARKRTRRQLERDVKTARRASKETGAAPPLIPDADAPPTGDPPVRWCAELTPLQNAQLEKLMEKLGRTDRGQLLLDAVATLVEKKGKNGTRVPSPATQVVMYRCEDCAAAHVPATHGMKRVAPAEAGAAQCDAVMLRTDGPNRARIKPKVRQKVLVRDRHRCTRCRSTSFLDVHHRDPRRKGGANRVENCVTLCRGCHVLEHREESMLERGVALEREPAP